MTRQNKILLFAFILPLLFCTCSRISEGSRKYARQIKPAVSAIFETEPVNQHKNEDAADDPAIWVNFTNPKESKIIGTDKKGGLEIYNLQGKKLFSYPDGKMNNVDTRYDFVLGNDTIDLVCASNRTTHSISIYSMQPDGSLKNVAARTIVSEMQEEVYGFTLYQNPDSHKVFAFINSKAGEIEQWELFATANMLVDARKIRAFHLHTQVEGMVADDENKVVFIGEEVNGIWKFDAEAEGNQTGILLEKSTAGTNENISYDIEGLAMYYLPNGDGYLLASIQGNYSYAVFERKVPHNYLGSFRVMKGSVDGAEETDGIDIYSFPLNEDFQHGILVVQDGYNHTGRKAQPQNFKLVQWETVSEVFSPFLMKN